ncbi:MAG: NAD-dependent epimerase/dehydratase family protein, partial [Gammaproteobacteria bacterium]
MKTLSLVTGGAGFIGSHIVDRLLADGYRVRVLDNFSTGKRENLPDSGDLEIITGDVGSFEDVHKAMKDAELVFHEAAIASVPKTIDDPIGSQRTNYQGTVNVLEAARQQGARRVVFASSAAVYGDLPELPKREDMPLKPLSPYAVDKLASEYACQMYTYLHGLETVCLRYFNIYGPRQDPGSPYSGVISIFAERLNKGDRPVIYGDGEQTRDFVFVSDVVEANIKAAITEKTAGKVINIATGRVVTLNELLKSMCRILNREFDPDYGIVRAGDIRHSSA